MSSSYAQLPQAPKAIPAKVLVKFRFENITLEELTAIAQNTFTDEQKKVLFAKVSAYFKGTEAEGLFLPDDFSINQGTQNLNTIHGTVELYIDANQVKENGGKRSLADLLDQKETISVARQEHARLVTKDFLTIPVTDIVRIKHIGFNSYDPEMVKRLKPILPPAQAASHSCFHQNPLTPCQEFALTLSKQIVENPDFKMPSKVSVPIVEPVKLQDQSQLQKVCVIA